MSRLVLSTLQGTTSNSNTVDVAAGHTLYAPGHVIQMVHNSFTTPTSVSVPVSSVSNTNIPDFFATITPKRTNSKIYITVRWFGEFSPQTATWNTMFGIKRNGTAIGANPNTGAGANGIAMAALSYYASDANSTPETMYLDYYDSPNTTTAVVYQLCANATDASTVIYTNRTVTAGAAAYEYGRSTITLWEIAQ